MSGREHAEHGSLAEEARRLAEAFSDWSHDRTVGLAADAGTSEDCRFCPLCQLIAVVRVQRPEVSARVVESGAAFLAALGSLASQPGSAAAEDPPPAAAAAAKVQHIDVG